jgi:hypothetical protein
MGWACLASVVAIVPRVELFHFGRVHACCRSSEGAQMLQNAVSKVVPRDETTRPTHQNVVRLIGHERASFDPDAIAAMTAAYHAVLTELRLSDREDAGTLRVAKCVVEIAARGERNPQRLTDATLEALSR